MADTNFRVLTRKERTHQVYEEIRKEYKKMRDKRKNGVRLYSDEYVLFAIGKKFFRVPKTIENIVFHRIK